VNVTRILHASVNVHGQLDETARWYVKTLGLAAAPRPDIPGIPGSWFTTGDSQIHLVGAPPQGTSIDPTGIHYCLAVDDIDAAIAELEADHIPFLRGSQGDVIQIWIVDPAGNTVELQQDHQL
jgi:catechol 2,3-dioxygenase-like lactoylglutathione lyase family enzyme